MIHLAAQLADALAHSHGRGIYHRDLKPSNVLMAPEGRPLLLDFNLSVDSRLPAWKIGGTLPYMAPEELANLARQKTGFPSPHYDPRSDLFSLGVIVYELLTGKLPFGAIPRDRPLEETARPVARTTGRRGRGRSGSSTARSTGVWPGWWKAAWRSSRSGVPRPRSSWPPRFVGNFPWFAAAAVGSAIIAVWLLGLGAALLSLSLAVILFFALRPPYSVRQLQLGLARIEQGEYAAAVDYLNNSIRSNPDSSEALFARGRAYQRLGEFQTAFQDYNSANRLKSNPIFNACKGYCLSRIKYHKDAIAAYRLGVGGGLSTGRHCCTTISATAT